MSTQIWEAGAAELAERVRAMELSPVEVLNAHLERIEAVNPRINTIVTLVDDALDRAKEAEAAIVGGYTIGPLHGVPFTIKDCVDTAGVRTTRGSRLFQDRVPAADARVVARLKAAGGILMAKTNLPEFTLWWETDNTVFGRTVNPWDFERTAGGSSGGEAAALAAGLSPLGIGSDVGGSIRNPAHNCGVVGLKPTHGRVPLTGHWPETLLRAMHVGPMARTVRDVDLALHIISGPDGVDPYAPPVPVPDRVVPDPGTARVTDSPDPYESLFGVKVGWNAGRAFGPVAPEVSDAVSRAARALDEAGCQVEEVPLPALEKTDTQALTATVYTAEGNHYFQPIVAGRKAELSPNIRRRLGARSPTLREYLDALADWEQVRQGMARYFREYELLLCPCVPLPAHPHDVTELTIAGETVAARNALRATIPWDVTGSPAISVPFARSSEGLPIGVQIVGRHFDEPTVLRAALALERVADSPGTFPPV